MITELLERVLPVGRAGKVRTATDDSRYKP
jgi:hypothetical protein